MKAGSVMYQMSDDKQLFLWSLKKVKIMMLLATDQCGSHVSMQNPRA